MAFDLAGARDPARVRRSGGDRDAWESWLKCADDIAGQLQTSAVERDLKGAPPHEEIAALKAAGLLAVLEPIEYGGGGATWSQAMRLVRRVSRGDTSIGQLLGYHYLVSRMPAFRADQEQAKAWSLSTIHNRLYWGGAVNPRGPQLTFVEDGDGFRVNGTKTFATGASVADFIVIRGTLEDRHVLAGVPTSRQGFSARFDWDSFGQRLTESGAVDFLDVRVERSEIFGGFPLRAQEDEDSRPWMTVTTPMMQLVFVNFYLGTAEGALREAVDYVKTKTAPWQTSGVAIATDDPYILELCGDLAAELNASVALADEAGRAVEQMLAKGHELRAEERAECAAYVYSAKVHSTKASLNITSRVFEMMGARATAKKYGFDRYWRNIRTHTLHDPVAYKAREVGQFALNGTLPVEPLYS